MIVDPVILWSHSTSSPATVNVPFCDTGTYQSERWDAFP